MDTVTLFGLFPLVLGLVFPLMFLAIGFAFFKTFASGSDVVAPSGPDQPWRLHARVFRPDQQFSLRGNWGPAQYGTLTLSATHLFWEPADGERWATSVRSITVMERHGAFSFGAPSVDIWIDGSGAWRLQVSDRPINRFMQNDAKRFREARVAERLADRLLGLGARRAE